MSTKNKKCSFIQIFWPPNQQIIGVLQDVHVFLSSKVCLWLQYAFAKPISQCSILPIFPSLSYVEYVLIIVILSFYFHKISVKYRNKSISRKNWRNYQNQILVLSILGSMKKRGIQLNWCHWKFLTCPTMWGYFIRTQWNV